MGVRETSIEAYYSAIEPSTLYSLIANHVKNNYPKGTTRKKISVDLDLHTATVSGIVRPLVKDGILIELEEKAPCPITGRNAYYVTHRSNLIMQIVQTEKPMPDKPLTDAEKLTAYAKEVRTMLELQRKYFDTASDFRKGKNGVIERDVRDALAKSKEQEGRVKKLTDKVLNPQTALL